MFSLWICDIFGSVICFPCSIFGMRVLRNVLTESMRMICHVGQRVDEDCLVNVSCHAHEWVMSHIGCHTYEWVMSHIWMSHVTHVNESCGWIGVRVSRIRGLSHECVMSHACLSHVTHMNESCHTCEWVVWVRRGYEDCLTNKAFHIFEWVMSYIWMGHVDTGWRRPIGCLKLQVIFRKRATNYRALLRKITYKDKASYDSTPPCRWKLVKDLKMVWLMSD